MMADGLHVYDDPVDTLANQPTFPWHMENLRTYITATSDFPQTATWRGAELKPYGAGAGMRGIPGDCYSPSRFVKAAYLNANYPQKESETENVVRMFRSLEGVVMIEGRPGWAMASSRRLSIPDALARARAIITTRCMGIRRFAT